VRGAGQSGRGRDVRVEHASHHDVAERVTRILA
jgi:hypothetical protein